MTHLEKYSEDIAKIACSGELFGVMRGDDRPVSCRNAICQNCLFYNARPDPDNWCSQDKRSKWLIPNADTKSKHKKQNETAFLRSLFCVNPPTNLW